jgi:hypothetical protein
VAVSLQGVDVATITFITSFRWLWLLVRRGLEHEGIRVEVGGRPYTVPVSPVDVEAAASAAVERAVALIEAPRRPPADPASATSGAPPARRR